MKSKSRGSVAVVAGLLLLPGCSGVAPESATIARAGRITLYEGLPHQSEERKSFDAERKSKPTLELHGYAFYREALNLNAGDEEKLRSLLKNPKAFEPFSGEKKCGGFHPDYAVEWSVGDKNYSCLICFGCGEAMIHGPGAKARYDIQPDSLKRLKDVLKSYRINRPPYEPMGAARHFPSSLNLIDQAVNRVALRRKNHGRSFLLTFGRRTDSLIFQMSSDREMVPRDSEASMTSNWERPGFEVLMVGAECTAYSGAQAVMHRPITESVASGYSAARLARSENPLPGRSRPALGLPPSRSNGSQSRSS